MESSMDETRTLQMRIETGQSKFESCPHHLLKLVTSLAGEIPGHPKA